MALRAPPPVASDYEMASVDSCEVLLDERGTAGCVIIVGSEFGERVHVMSARFLETPLLLRSKKNKLSDSHRTLHNL